MAKEAADSKERYNTLMLIRKYVVKTLGGEASEENFRKVTWTMPDGKMKTKRFYPRDGMENLWQDVFSTANCPPYFIIKHNGNLLQIEPEWYRDHTAAELAARHLPLNKEYVLPPRFIEYMGDTKEMEVTVENIFPPNQ